MREIKNVPKQNLLIFSFFIILAIFWSGFGCAQYREIKEEDYVFKKIKVLSNIQKINEPYFIYEDNLVVIQFNHIDIKETLEGFIKENNFIGYIDLKNKLESLNKMIYDYNDFNKEEKTWIKMIFASLLEKGKFLLIGKKDNSTIKEITISYFDYNPELLWGGMVDYFFFHLEKCFFELSTSIINDVKC